MSKNYDISISGVREAEGRPSEASLMCFFESWLFFKTRFEVSMKKIRAFCSLCTGYGGQDTKTCILLLTILQLVSCCCCRCSGSASCKSYFLRYPRVVVAL